MASELTHQRLLEVLNYEPASGVFTWRMATTNRVHAGDVAGYLANGYWMIGIDGAKFGAHRLAVFYTDGHLPAEDVDHRDGDTLNNRRANLLPCTHAVNMQNERGPRRNNATGFLGVHLCQSTGRYRADLSIGGNAKNLGRFDTAIEAHEAYLAAKREHHPGCTL